MHLEEPQQGISKRNTGVSILVSNWMHLEDVYTVHNNRFYTVSILVSNWMHLEEELERLMRQLKAVFQS